MARLTREQYVATILARIKGTYDENVEILQKQYPTWQDYFCWVAAMLEADFMLQACNQKDLAGILLAGVPAFGYDHSVEYIGLQYDNIVAEDDEDFIDQGFNELNNRVKALLKDEEDGEEF